MYLNRDKFNYFSVAEISEENWRDIVALGTMKTAKAGTMLYEQSTIINELTCIVEGTVKTVHFFDNGNEKLYEQLSVPSFIGHEALWCDDAETYYPTVIAVTDVCYSVMPIKQAEEFMIKRPDMMVSLFQCIRNVTCINRIKSVCAMPMSLLQKAAFALVFLRKAEKDAEGYVSVTHEEIAQLVGISRANVTTALAGLAESGLIDKRRGKVKILDNDRLMNLLDNPF